MNLVQNKTYDAMYFQDIRSKLRYINTKRYFQYEYLCLNYLISLAIKLKLSQLQNSDTLDVSSRVLSFATYQENMCHVRILSFPWKFVNSLFMNDLYDVGFIFSFGLRAASTKYPHL